MATTDAWLLRIADSLLLAVGQRELVHLEQDPKITAMPGAPAYCRHLMVWRKELIAAFDLAVLAGVRPAVTGDNAPLAAIVAYQESPGATPRHGAFLLGVSPELVEVDGNQGCHLPVELDAWRQISKACFRFGDDFAVPVLNCYSLFETRPVASRAWPGEQIKVA